MRVLIVEDTVMIQQSLVAILSAINLSVDCASTGDEAIRLLLKNRDEEDRYSIVIVDMFVPLRTGEESQEKFGLKLLKDVYSLISPEARSFVYTAHPQFEDCIAAAKLGADGYFTKGKDDEKLLEACREVVTTKNQPFLDKWISNNYAELAEKFPDKTVVLFDGEALPENDEPIIIGGRVVMGFEDDDEAQSFLLGSRDLRWGSHEIFSVST